MTSKRIAIFASGSGTNAENIIRYFMNSPAGDVVLVLSNKKDAGVLQRAEKLSIPTHVFNKKDFYESRRVLDMLIHHRIDFIVLAGFLLLIPEYLIEAYPQRIINIHPALLPKYGGKGMYGGHVHDAVKAAGEVETGITIHHVNQEFDQGEIIFQKKCTVNPDDTADDIAAKVHQLEYAYFPKVIEQLLIQTD